MLNSFHDTWHTLPGVWPQLRQGDPRVERLEDSAPRGIVLDAGVAGLVPVSHRIVSSHGCSTVHIETDRNPNLWYLPKPNILLNAKYSANGRIIGCRIVPTQ